MNPKILGVLGSGFSLRVRLKRNGNGNSTYNDATGAFDPEP